MGVENGSYSISPLLSSIKYGPERDETDCIGRIRFILKGFDLMLGIDS